MRRTSTHPDLIPVAKPPSFPDSPFFCLLLLSLDALRGSYNVTEPMAGSKRYGTHHMYEIFWTAASCRASRHKPSVLLERLTRADERRRSSPLPSTA
ncbi:hypothetical protein BVI1335_2130020 [Burkholderia vietnamiensis]|nr:hypothetical protein BVI1335_2130020 [Burkholderia vietnamiensis]